jgi:hypothetical protein
MLSDGDVFCMPTLMVYYHPDLLKARLLSAVNGADLGFACKH